jgi:phage terminase large subunit
MGFKRTTAFDIIFDAFKEKKPYIGFQGSQGAGKTWNILYILMELALEVPNLKITIAGAELSKMRTSIIDDFKVLANMIGVYEDLNMKADKECHLRNGTRIFFVGLLDKADFGKGYRSHFLFVNEADRIPFANFTEIESRADTVIVDFNPTRKFWYHTEIMPHDDCVHRVLTFEHNEALGIKERNKILKYKEKGYAEDGTIISEFWANRWQVMGLGQLGSPEGRIFYWNECTYQDFLKFDGVEVYGVDWGIVDPWAIIAAKYKDGVLMLHELNYASENEWWAQMSEPMKKQVRGYGDEGLVTWLFNRIGIPKDKTIICDTNRKDKIIQLRKSGWPYAVEAYKPKGSILGGISDLRNLEVYYTNLSPAIRHESENYVWDKDRHGIQLEKPVDLDNHTMDAARYIDSWLTRKGYHKVL